jgi:GntR family transcriptional regulator
MQVTHTISGEGSVFFQIQALIIQRIIDGIWPPSERLPSEFALAKEFKVLQGTVRKSIDTLIHKNLLIRHQGRDTFVSSHSDQREFFWFCHHVENNNISQSPQTSHLISHQRRKCSPKESKHLKISKAAYTQNIRPVRSMRGIPFIIENIVVPDALITELGKETGIPNELYQLYEQAYSENIHKVVEHFPAGTLTHSKATYLSLQEGDPLLEIDGLAATLDGTPVEWSVSRCYTSAHSYIK